MREERNTNNDLISRKWLTDAIRNRRTYLSYEDAKDVIDLIDNAPTVERPQGKWRNLPHKTSLRYKCSICGSFSRIKSLYCPWCGTKMEVEYD